MKTFFSPDHKTINIDAALLLARLTIGVLMLTHGIPKIALLSESAVPFMDFMGLGPKLSLILALMAEVVCSILIIIGLGTRFAVIPLMITMLIAVLIIHAADPFSMKEMGLHYILVYLMLLLMGSGKYSVDSFITKKLRHD